MKGAIFLPSLGRPHLVKRFITSYEKTGSSIPLWVVVDENDPKLQEYKDLILPEKGLLKITKARTMGGKSRELWDEYKDFDYFIILNDDHVCVTPSWDQAVISQVQGHNIVFTNDGYVNANGPTRIAGAICFSGKWIRALGYLFLPGQDHLYSDDLWQALCARPQCAFYLHDVLVEHKHAYQDKDDQDDTFFIVNGPKGLNPETRVGEGGFWPNDSAVFKKWVDSGEAEKDVQKIMNIQPKTGVMVATPSHDNKVIFEYALGLADFQMSLRSQNQHIEVARVVGSSLVPHARNSLCDMFMKSKCQKMLFIDADQAFNADSCWPLFRSSRRIVAAITPHKRFPINLNFEPLEQDRHFFKDLVNKSMEEFIAFAKARADANGEIEVNRAGTGMICIDRSVFDILGEEAPAYFAFDNSDTVEHKEFFRMGIAPTRRYKGEDWSFCEDAKRHGIPIYINASCVIGHHGGWMFAV